MKLEFTKIGFESARMLGREIGGPDAGRYSNLSWSINEKDIVLKTLADTEMLLHEIFVAANKPREQRKLIVEVPKELERFADYLKARIHTALNWTTWDDINYDNGKGV